MGKLSRYIGTIALGGMTTLACKIPFTGDEQKEFEIPYERPLKTEEVLTVNTHDASCLNYEPERSFIEVTATPLLGENGELYHLRVFLREDEPTMEKAAKVYNGRPAKLYRDTRAQQLSGKIKPTRVVEDENGINWIEVDEENFAPYHVGTFAPGDTISFHPKAKPKEPCEAKPHKYPTKEKAAVPSGVTTQQFEEFSSGIQEELSGIRYGVDRIADTGDTLRTYQSEDRELKRRVQELQIREREIQNRMQRDRKPNNYMGELYRIREELKALGY